MYYYMKLSSQGLGIHGTKRIIRKHESHGCVRVLIDDAKWLNKNFIDHKTNIIIKEY